MFRSFTSLSQVWAHIIFLALATLFTTRSQAQIVYAAAVNQSSWEIYFLKIDLATCEVCAIDPEIVDDQFGWVGTFTILPDGTSLHFFGNALVRKDVPPNMEQIWSTPGSFVGAIVSPGGTVYVTGESGLWIFDPLTNGLTFVGPWPVGPYGIGGYCVNFFYVNGQLHGIWHSPNGGGTFDLTVNVTDPVNSTFGVENPNFSNIGSTNITWNGVPGLAWGENVYPNAGAQIVFYDPATQDISLICTLPPPFHFYANITSAPPGVPEFACVDPCITTNAGYYNNFGPYYGCQQVILPTPNSFLMNPTEVMNWILYTDPNDPIGSTLITSTGSYFNFDPNVVSTGVNYYAAAIAGNNFNGIVDLDDPCLDISDSVQVQFTLPPAVAFSTAQPEEVCPGNCRSVTANFTGIPPYTLWGYLLSGSTILEIFNHTFNANTGTFDVCIPAGTPEGTVQVEAVTIENSLCNCVQGNCNGLGSITFEVVAPPEPMIDGPTEMCAGGVATLTVTPAFESYLWSGSQTTPGITVNNPGTYTVTVTNAGGCTGTQSFTIAPGSAPSPVISPNPYACNGQITLNAGGPYSSYSWSNGGGSGQTASYSSPGTYTVTVSDVAGCTGTAEFVATIPGPPVVSISGNLSFCSGAGTTLSATPGFVSYSWTGGGASETINAVSGGAYTVTVTDANGCTDTETATVIENPSPMPLVSNGQVCPGGTTTIGVTNGPFSNYNWDIGGSGPTIVAGPGVYSVTVTAANGCTGTTNASITAFPSPSPGISASPYTCNGQVTLGVGPYQGYLWSNMATTPGITVNTPGIYTVTVTDANGCTGTDQFDVTIPTPPVVSISGDNSFCQGGAGTLNATPGFAAYNWSNGQSGPNISVSNAGTFTVVVTDTYGCTATASQIVALLPAPTPVISGPTGFCEGSTGLLQVTGAYSAYAWNTSENTPSILASNGGIYTVTVTDANGCTGTDTYQINMLPAPNPVISPEPYNCNGAQTLDAGSGYLTYLWSTSATTSEITANMDGLYSVTVTAVNGCTGTDAFQVTIPAPPLVSITGDLTFCESETAVLNASGGLNAYTWNTGQNGPQLVTSTSGTFTVTASDIYGCTATANFTTLELPAPQPQINGPLQICEGESAMLSTTQLFSQYAWSNGDNTPSILVQDEDMYTVVVTASNGCTGTDQFSLNVLPSPAPQISEAAYQCDNMLTLTAPSGFTSYVWSTTAMTPAIVVDQDGAYSLTVTNAAGCTGTAEYLALIPQPPAVVITGDDAICPGESSLLDAGAGYSDYLWWNNANTPTVAVTASGNYAVTVTDAFGCTAADIFSVSLLSAPTPQISGPSQICAGGTANFSVAGAYTQISWNIGINGSTISTGMPGDYSVTVTAANGCTGSDTQTLTISNSLQPQIVASPYACNGQVSLDAGGGFAQYLWSGAETTQIITVTSNGVYEVTVGDGNGCFGAATLSVTIPEQPTVDISSSGPFCAGTTATLNATPGLTSYVWDGGQVGPTLMVTQAGVYSVTATDAAGCTAVNSVSISTLPAPQPIIQGNTVICTGNSGQLNLSSTYAQYLWSTNETGPQITITTGDWYSVTVTDAFGCTGTDTQFVTESTQLSPQIILSPYDCSGQQTLNVGAGYAGYLWSTGATTAQIQAASDGLYSVAVHDAFGCSGTTSVLVNIPALPQVSISGNTSFCENTSTTLIASPGFAAYQWTGGATSNSLPVSTGGFYTVTATDANGCTAVSTVQIMMILAPQPFISAPPSVCAGQSATLSTSGTYAQYLWSNGGSTNSITVNSGGLYELTVVDFAGCTGSNAVTLNTIQPPQPDITEQPYACDGQVTLAANGMFSTYLWSTGEQTPTIDASLAGAYALTVTDAAGCSGAATYLLDNVPQWEQTSINGPTGVCPSATAILSASGSFSQYLWNTGATGSSLPISAGGNYEVVATDAQGCTSTAMFTVENWPTPTPIVNGPSTVCPGNTATLTVSGAYMTYAWSTGQNTPQISVAAPYSGTVSVTDANGCVGASNISVAESNDLTPTITLQPYACDGTLSLSTESGFSNYSWNIGGGSSTISVSQSGLYTVTVSDGGGCSGTAEIQVTVPIWNPVTIIGQDLLCAGTSQTLSASAGFNAYQWGNGETSASLAIVSPGIYDVTATDIEGCTSVASIMVSDAPIPIVAISGNNQICGNQPVTLSVPDIYTNILWSNGEQVSEISVSAPGVYAVTVSNAGGCTATDSFEVVAGGSITVQAQALPYACDGIVILQVDQAFIQIQWSTGDQTAEIQVNQSGLYTVTVSDASGCSGSATVTATIPPPPVANISGDLSPCDGMLTILTAPSGYNAYLWNNGMTTAGIQVGEGVYSLTVTDAFQCTASASAIVSTQVLSPTLQSNEVICDGNDLTIVVSGTYAQYMWSDGSTQSNLTVMQPGFYTVTVTDQNGCTGVATTDILAVPPAMVEINYGSSVLCGGVVTLSATGSVGVFEWSSGQSGSQIDVDQPGAYVVTLTDVNGCTAIDQVDITAGGQPVFTQIERITCRPQSAGTTVEVLTALNGCDSTVTTITTYQAINPVLQLDLGPDISAQTGESVHLNITGNFQIDTLTLQGPYVFSCANCLMPTFTATQSGTIEVHAYDPEGCPVEAEVLVLVRTKVDIYVPNSIQIGSPDNGYLSVFSGLEVQTVKNFHVYDRWGNALFSRDDMPTNVPEAGWNGYFRGKPMQPGVYVYYFEVDLADGSTLVYSGDVTIIE